ncbi:MAG: hypothetical protein ACE5E8_02105 [Acidimicrobiia bacterium]
MGAAGGPVPVQLRFATKLTSEQYVSSRAWREASLAACPIHGGTACGFSRHGTYERKFPAGTRVPRWYCRLGHCTFSLLADCFASRLPGTLAEIEEVLVEVERAPSQEKAAERFRTDIELPGALRWMRRRLKGIRLSLPALIGLLPSLLFGSRPTIADFRLAVGVEPVLPELRETGSRFLHCLPPPLGFGPRPERAPPRSASSQQPMGTELFAQRT